MDAIQDIVRGGLCVRCGGCVAICPIEGAISLDGSLYPVIDCTRCNNCGLCPKVCPAADMDLPALYREVLNQDVRDAKEVGFYLDTHVAHAASKEVRRMASSGGFITQFLLYLLETRKVDGCVVVSNLKDPLNPAALLTSSPPDVRNSTGSKYSIVPVNSCLKKLSTFSGKIAFVGLPCHIQSLKMWGSFNDKIKNKIAVTVGLFCHSTLEKDALVYLLKRSRISPDEVASVNFRGGKWPGGVKAVLKNGDERPLHNMGIKDAFNYLYKVYCPDPCRNCTDFCAELSDIAVGDPWLKGHDGEYLFRDSRSLVVTRTETGRKYMEEVRRSGQILFEEIPPALFEINFLPVAKEKRRNALLRISKLKKRGRRYPINHLKIPRFGFKERANSKIHNFQPMLFKFGLMRGLYLLFAFSRYGEGLAFIKSTVKKKVFSIKQRLQKSRPSYKVYE